MRSPSALPTGQDPTHQRPYFLKMQINWKGESGLRTEPQRFSTKKQPPREVVSQVQQQRHTEAPVSVTDESQAPLQTDSRPCRHHAGFAGKQHTRVRDLWRLAPMFQQAPKARQCVAKSDSLPEGSEKPLYEMLR